MDKTVNNKAWFLVIPVLVLVAFSAVIPLMTVVNYSVQDTFGNNEFFWAGTDWFVQMLHSPRFWDALIRNLIFSLVILAIEIPLGILIALNMPKKGLGVPVCLVLMALPLLIPGMSSVPSGRFSVASISAFLATTFRSSASITTIRRTRWTPGQPSSSWMSGTGQASSCCSAMPASSPYRMPIIKRLASMAPRGGPSSASFNCLR